jgi:hypothetical protein
MLTSTNIEDLDLSSAPLGDPLLVVIWNDNVLAARAQQNPAWTKRAVIQRLLDNGGVDTKNSGSIFHFKLKGDIQSARDDFLRNEIWGFGTTPQMEAYFGAAHHRDPVAETYEVTRITRNEVDYAILLLLALEIVLIYIKHILYKRPCVIETCESVLNDKGYTRDRDKRLSRRKGRRHKC